MISGHGDDYFNYHSISINFSSNVYQSSAIPVLEKYLQSQLHLITRYPEPDAASLKQMISRLYDIEPQQLWVTNGAIEAIYLIAQAFSNKQATILSPTFSEYADASQIHGIEITYINRLEEYQGESDLFWLCNPNNPTGTHYNDDQLIHLFQSFPDTVFVVDESYQAFVDHSSENTLKFNRLPNVITLHSLTKCFAIPGLRLGYCSASQSLIQAISDYAMPWSVNQLAIQAGKFLLEKRHQFQIPLASLHAETHKLRCAIDQITPLKALMTSTHFFLVLIQNQCMTASELKDILAHQYGILIRDCGNFEGLTPYYFRLATQTAKDNQSLIYALQMIFND